MPPSEPNGLSFNPLAVVTTRQLQAAIDLQRAADARLRWLAGFSGPRSR